MALDSESAEVQTRGGVHHTDHPRRRAPSAFLLLGVALERRGVQLYGGKVYEDNPRLAETTYVDAHYDVLNFNDFANGYVPLFAMIATGGPFTEFIEMSYAVTSIAGLGCIYFVSFYVVGCLVAVNVFSAFVIDAFLSQYEEGRARRGGERVA